MERPILFKPEMVKAILEGRKTQTRRIISPQPDRIRKSPFVKSGIETVHGYEIKCPYNVDRLWVKETWQPMVGWEDTTPSKIPVGEEIRYLEDCLSHPEKYPMINGMPYSRKYDCSKWRPSIFMMRWMSRINLEITNVRVERVQDVTEEDATAEGCQPFSLGEGDIPTTAKWSFEILWNKINEPRGFGWDVNPWVWVIEFKIK